MWRWSVVVGNALFLGVDGPGEWADFLHCLCRPDVNFHWRLALGLAIKNALVLGTLVGLAQDREYGQVCMAAESLHSILIRYAAFAGIRPSTWALYLPQLGVPALDIAFRLSALVFFWKYTLRRQNPCEAASAV